MVKLPDDTQSSARLKVVEKPVKILVPLTLTPAEPLLGGEFVLSITLDRDVKPDARWMKSGKDLATKRDSRISFQEEIDADSQGVRYSMTIRDAKPEDEGTYRFEVQPNNISESKIVNLIEPKILIVQCDEKVTGKLGDSVTLTCELNLPQGQVTWYHDGIKVASSDSQPMKSSGFSIQNVDAKRSLTILALKKDDFGAYSVKSKDDKRAIELVPSNDDDQLKVLEHPPKVLDLDQGDQLILSIVTNRKCRIEFSKDNQVLKTTDTFDKDKNRYTVTLDMGQVTLNDGGIYQSKIVGTQFEYRTEILVHDPYQRQKTDVLEAEMPLLFIKKLEDQKVTEGVEVLLECQLNRAPKSPPVWYQDGKEITSNENRMITQDDTRLQLRIPRVSTNDQAEYTLLVETLRGHAFVDLVSVTEHTELASLSIGTEKREDDVQTTDISMNVIMCLFSRLSAFVSWRNSSTRSSKWVHRLLFNANYRWQTVQSCGNETIKPCLRIFTRSMVIFIDLRLPMLNSITVENTRLITTIKWTRPARSPFKLNPSLLENFHRN